MTTRLGHPSPRVRGARLDNVALVPGSMLPYIETCQELANRLPDGGVLIVVPANNPAQKQSLLLVAKLLAANGHQVSVVPADSLSQRTPYIQAELAL